MAGKKGSNILTAGQRTKAKSQTQKLLDYLLTGKSITSLQAVSIIGSVRYSARISEVKDILKQNPDYAGYVLHDVWEYGEAENGNKTRWKRWTLLKVVA